MSKADKLNTLVNNSVNVAQFVSVSKDNIGRPQYSHICGQQHKYESTEEAVVELLQSSNSGTVNIRSFGEYSTKGNRFVMGKSIDDLNYILDVIRENSENELHSIINENIDVCDGGVSGVVVGDTIEFSPNDTPRCVEKTGVCLLPRQIGIDILEVVYGFKPTLDFDKEYRVEFSIHPLKQGVRDEHTIIWEYEKVDYHSDNQISFPNNFSEHIGDKVFGLLLLNALGIRVPKSMVVSRKIAPFTFGSPTGSYEKWFRTAPVVKEAGKFTTCKGWIDPFKQMAVEDEKHQAIGSIISQDSVTAIYSGASLIRDRLEDDVIEGTSGRGDDFMVGKGTLRELPSNVIKAVKQLHEQIRQYKDLIGSVSIEWVYDGADVWVVQLNQISDSVGLTDVIVGEDRFVSEYLEFDVNKGLEPLRQLVSEIDKSIGIELIGNIGVTSHLGDILRQSNTPSFITRV